VYRNTLLLALALVFASACKSSPSGGLADAGNDAQDSGGMIGGGDTGSTMTGDAGDDYPSSGKATIRYKRAERLRNDYAQALGLDRSEVCNELGQYSCTDVVHTIALGGVEPYLLGVLEPLQFTTITTPIAVERVAFSSCTERVKRDLAAPDSAVIFKDLGLDDNGAIKDLDASGIGDSLTTLYRRALQRDPGPAEIQHLKDLYKDVAATNEPSPGRDWAILVCFSVMTTMEALFY
jgi:hypothetical protein